MLIEEKDIKYIWVCW